MINGVDDFRVDADVAVLDTGIDRQHPDLNVAGGIDCTYYTGWWFNRTYYCEESADGDDDHYHGTHVAGTIGALDNGDGVVGVAPGARLWAVKVLDAQGSGYTSGIIAGIEWVVEHNDIEVINMSLGGSGQSTAYRNAIDAAVASGVVVVVSAGNDDANANNYSPAFVPSAITVSALADFDGAPGGSGSQTCRSDQDDTLADFSNYGPVVDIAAPGVCILSTFPLEQGGSGTISGTSMAAPHVAGAAALLASGPNAPTNAADVQAIRDTLVAFGNYNWTDDSGDGIQEALLDVGAFIPGGDPGPNPDPGPEPDPNNPPDANFSFTCDSLSCNFTNQSSDSDGSIASRTWTFGDGASSTANNPSHAYANAGTYSVTLTVVDDDGEADSIIKSVAVEAAPPPAEFTLTVSPSYTGSRHYAELSWSGTDSSRVDIYRNGARIRSTSNDGSYRDSLRYSTGVFTYRICEQNSNVCSNEAAVSF
jgi:PKD repeat protein